MMDRLGENYQKARIYVQEQAMSVSIERLLTAVGTFYVYV